MRRTILSVAFPLATVSADAVGGAEQVLWAIDRALTRAGVRSIVVAAAGSKVHGELRATSRVGERLDPETHRRAQREHARIIAEVLAHEPVDLVHLHGVDFHGYLPTADVPALVTLHLPTAWYPREALAPARPRTYLHCVSESQHGGCATSSAFLPPIVNGVETDAEPAPKSDQVVALGRICPEKGYHVALDAARRAGARMLLAGRAFGYPEHQRYFQSQIVPRLDERRRFVGPLGRDEKRRVLASARCVLVPSLVPETSSLVAMEALACGTPVVAFPNGALAEIVEHGTTGFLVHDECEMAEAIEAAGSLDPEVCRETARRRFSAARMIERYLATYEAIIRGGQPAGALAAVA